MSEPILIASYINKPAFPYPCANEPYHLRRRNWTVPFAIPPNHEVVVKVNGEETRDFHYYSSVVTLAKQPADFDEITITTKPIEEDESKDS